VQDLGTPQQSAPDVAVRGEEASTPDRGDRPDVVRVVAVTQSDPFFTGRFFDAFLRELQGLPVELVEIVVLRNFNESKGALARRLLRFYGPVDFTRLLGRYVGAAVGDRLGAPRTVESLAQAHGIPLRRLASINNEEYLATLRAREIDVLLSVAAPQIFRAAALAAAPLVLNVHNGRLPHYRGMMPTFWALLNGEHEISITVHEMAAKLDAGRVVAEYPMAIEEGESAFALSARAKVVAGSQVARLLARLGTDEWPVPRPVEMTEQRYYGFPTGADARALRARGTRLL